ncbi:conjugal transfer protein TraV [Methylocaldum sp. BRCS4]|jgi:conjugal transfer pilus assembly protein TraV|uniref:TraV family lipoprotein n=1 Tax=Methylocaldum sp. 14B TaxID=1912213 RepID=UPI00098A817A|nr:TraV family lipoprotein [Methylocaldum sp. 14B]MVF23687.1 conjugal transfer protein TraV [Methylocaldum sp. BRCS4]
MMRGLATIVFALTLAGCSTTKYACKGMPEDPTCLSAVDAYKATDKASTTIRPTDATAPTSASTTPVATAIRPADPVPAPKIDDPTPIRTPAKVMRVWVAPWEDADGDLNVSGFVFTELEPRRWMIGRPLPTMSPSISPLQVLHRTKEHGRTPALPAEKDQETPMAPLYGEPEEADH